MACISKRRNRWVIDFYDQHGKRRWETMPEGSTKKKARDRLWEIEEKVDKRAYLPDKKVPLFSEVAEDWVEHKKPNLRETTWEVYEGHVRNHFEDFKDSKINRITTAKVEKFITKRQNKGMNIATLRKILVTLNQIFSYGVRHRYIDHNPLSDAERPRGKGGHKDKKMVILTPEQIKALLLHTEELKYRILFALAIFTGARQGELLGLKWEDLDWANSQIHFKRTFNKGRFFDPKTAKSYRSVTLPPMVLDLLEKWKEVCSGSDLVFPNRNGNPINYSNMMNRHYKPALKAAGLPGIRFHDLRHTYASIRLDQGNSVVEVSEDLGHSTPTVTLNVYAHKVKRINMESALRLESTVFGQDGSKMVAQIGQS
jgi:integrase